MNSSTFCLLLCIITGGAFCRISENLLVPVGSTNSEINCTCGRIFNYTEAGTGKMPWLAVLVNKNDPNRIPLCWGSLINDRYILSAASCTSQYKAENVEIVLDRGGEHDHCLSSSIKIASVSSIKNHPRFSVGNHTYDNDISLIKLRDHINLSKGDKIVPVCLPPEDSMTINNKVRYYDGKNLIHNHNGFGGTAPRKSRMEAFLMLNKECDFTNGDLQEKRMIVGVWRKDNNQYPQNADKRYHYSLLVLLGLRHEYCFKFYKNRVEAQFFCAEGISGEKFLKSREWCNTDPGSPLITLRRTKYKCDPDFSPIVEKDIVTVRFVQTGISTMQKECIVLKHHPYPILLFTNVSRYRKWIRENTDDARYCFNSP